MSINQLIALAFATVVPGLLANFLYDVLRIAVKKIRRYIKRAKK